MNAYRMWHGVKSTVRFGSALFLMCVCVLLFRPEIASANPKYASIVMDSDTGAILHASHADVKRHPASLVKVMTLLMAFEAIENGQLTLRDRIPISRHAASMIPSKLDLPVGSSIRVEDAIYALVTKSANDVAVALAEKIGGTESRFASMMTTRARQIGMGSTTFRNASGLHDPGQISTARDMARLGQYVIQRYPHYYHYFSTRNFSYRGKSYHNHNRLMESYHGMDGIKTGYINASGFNLLASAKRDGRRVVAVVFGGRTSKTRNAHMQQLLDRAFVKIARTPALVAVRTPIPPRKPTHAIQLASLVPQAGKEVASHFANLNTEIIQNGPISALVGQGDFDVDQNTRIQTGMIAAAAVTGEQAERVQEQQRGNMPKRISVPPTPNDRNWSIQVGAFSSRTQTDRAIQDARRELPSHLVRAQSVIVPLKTTQGWIFRGRLIGFTKVQAEQACQILRDCLPVSPDAR